MEESGHHGLAQVCKQSARPSSSRVPPTLLPNAWSLLLHRLGSGGLILLLLDSPARDRLQACLWKEVERMRSHLYLLSWKGAGPPPGPTPPFRLFRIPGHWNGHKC